MYYTDLLSSPNIVHTVPTYLLKSYNYGIIDDCIILLYSFWINYSHVYYGFSARYFVSSFIRCFEMSTKKLYCTIIMYRYQVNVTARAHGITRTDTFTMHGAGGKCVCL